MPLEHGSYSISKEDDIIRYDVSGSFNGRGAKAWSEAVKSEIESLNGRPFKVLVSHLQLEGGTPEAYDIADAFNQWLNKQNMLAKAIVSQSPIVEQIERRNVSAKQHQNICYFSTLDEAVTWLRSIPGSKT